MSDLTIEGTGFLNNILPDGFSWEFMDSPIFDAGRIITALAMTKILSEKLLERGWSRFPLRAKVAYLCSSYVLLKDIHTLLSHEKVRELTPIIQMVVLVVFVNCLHSRLNSYARKNIVLERQLVALNVQTVPVDKIASKITELQSYTNGAYHELVMVKAGASLKDAEARQKRLTSDSIRTPRAGNQTTPSRNSIRTS